MSRATVVYPNITNFIIIIISYFLGFSVIFKVTLGIKLLKFICPRVEDP